MRPAALAWADDAASPAGPCSAARAALSRPQDYRWSALSLLIVASRQSPAARTRVKPVTAPVSDLQGTVTAAAGELRGNGLPEVPGLERPPKPDFGDYSTNAAMLL